MVSRIHGELLKLGIQITEPTVAKYMVRHRQPPCCRTRPEFIDDVRCWQCAPTPVNDAQHGVYFWLNGHRTRPVHSDVLPGSDLIVGHQVLCLDIGTDILPALALGAEPPASNVLERPSHGYHLLDRAVLLRSFGLLGPTEALIEMIAFVTSMAAFGWRPGMASPAGSEFLTAAGAAFLAVVIGQMANAFACRSTTRWPGALGSDYQSPFDLRSSGRISASLGVPVCWSACRNPRACPADSHRSRFRDSRVSCGAPGRGVPEASSKTQDAENGVAVGTAVADRPPHRSGRAELPHTALA
jgi:Cation transporting ATPase, C-terminus